MLSSAALMSVGCDMEPEYYSEVTPTTFYTSQDKVWQRMSSPLAQWHQRVVLDRTFMELQEMCTDEAVWTTHNGSSPEKNGIGRDVAWHNFTNINDDLYNRSYKYIAESMGFANAAIEDLDRNVDFDALGFPSGTKENMIAQIQIVNADCYYHGLDQWGGWPIYEVGDTEAKARSTDVETFQHIEKLITENIANLKVKSDLNATVTSEITQGYAALLLARLYFNASSFTKDDPSFAKGTTYYEKCAKICEDILAGKYGKYELEKTWNGCFKRTNQNSPEIIYGVPLNNAYDSNAGNVNWGWSFTGANQYFGGCGSNGLKITLTPSEAPDGTPYTTKLGRPYSKFHDQDLRKQRYTYEKGGDFTGMFCGGYMVNNSKNAQGKDWKALGSSGYDKTKVIYQFDRIAPYTVKSLVTGAGLSEDCVASYADENGNLYNKKGNKIDLSVYKNLPSNNLTADVTSGYVIVKLRPVLDLTDFNDFNDTFTLVVGRLAEVYYTLAECYWRMGRKQDACNLINTVRKRNFANGNDPDSVTVANLDEWRFLDEWMVEFLAENRRRTDLIRWDKFVTGEWWDHKPDTQNTGEVYKDPYHLTRFAIPAPQLSANNLLEQNPGY